MHGLLPGCSYILAADLKRGKTASHGLPGEGGAPGAVGSLDDTLEGGELAEVFVFLRAHHLEEGFYFLLGIVVAGSRELLGEHRGRRLRDGASTPDEAHFLEGAIMHVRVDRDVVTAQRIIYVLFDGCVFQFVPVARTLEVVQDYLFVEALYHRAKIVSGACWRGLARGYHAPPPPPPPLKLP